MLELLVVALGFAVCLGMISRTKCRGNAKLSVNSLHNLTGKLGASVGDHLVPKTVMLEGAFQQYVHCAICINGLATWGYNYALCESVNHTVNGVVTFTFWKVGNEVDCDGAKGTWIDRQPDAIAHWLPIAPKFSRLRNWRRQLQCDRVF